MVFTKWWSVKIEDYMEILRGCPFPFVCPGWHTSMSLQIFVLELVADIFVYFLFWFLIILTATKFTKQFRVAKIVTITLLVTSGLFTVVLILLALNPDNIYTTTRPFDIEIKDTGYRFMWQDRTQPHYGKYPDPK
jgi:hypothetical protein